VPSYPQINRWEPGLEIEDLHKSMMELREVVRQLQDTMEYGSMRGAYFPLQWEITGAPPATGQYGRWLIDWTMKPVYVGLYSRGGESTIDLNEDGTSFLASPLTSVSSEGVYKNAYDFTSDEIGGPGKRLRLDLDARDAGVNHISVVLICKSVQKIDRT
jgi:hypothetical protein